MTIKILHLSDFHFEIGNVSQNIVKASLNEKIEQLVKKKANTIFL
jgi:hypothetical protein